MESFQAKKEKRKKEAHIPTLRSQRELLNSAGLLLSSLVNLSQWILLHGRNCVCCLPYWGLFIKPEHNLAHQTNQRPGQPHTTHMREVKMIESDCDGYILTNSQRQTVIISVTVDLYKTKYCIWAYIMFIKLLFSLRLQLLFDQNCSENGSILKCFKLEFFPVILNFHKPAFSITLFFRNHSICWFGVPNTFLTVIAEDHQRHAVIQ